MSFLHTQRFNTLFKQWVKSRVGAIPRLPCTVSRDLIFLHEILVKVKRLNIYYLGFTIRFLNIVFNKNFEQEITKPFIILYYGKKKRLRDWFVILDFLWVKGTVGLPHSWSQNAPFYSVLSLFDIYIYPHGVRKKEKRQ